MRDVALTVGRWWAASSPTERGGYRLARAVRRIIPRRDWRGVFEVAPGCRIQLDLASYPDCSMAIAVYELDTVRLMKRILRPGDHFIDAGANIGYLTLMAAKMVGAAGRVDAIEPMPANFARLVSNIGASGAGNVVTAHAVAASDREGELTLYFPDSARSGGNHGLTSAYLPDGLRQRSVRIPCTRLDSLFSTATPALIKLDVEGAEPLVVAGMRKLLTGPRVPHVILEVNPETSRNAGFEVGEAVRIALSMQPSYEVWTIGWTSRKLQRPVEELASIGQANIWLRPA